MGPSVPVDSGWLLVAGLEEGVNMKTTAMVCLVTSRKKLVGYDYS